MEFLFGPVESLDAVPESFRPLYGAEAKEGKFLPLESHKGVIDAIVGLNKSLRGAREDAKKRPNVDLSLLAEFGDSPEKIKETFTGKLKELNDQIAAGGKVNVAKIKEDFAKEHGVEINKLNARNTALQGQLYKLLVENAAKDVLMSAKGSPDLLLPHIKANVKVVEEGDEFKVFVVDAAGDRRYSTVTGQPMSLVELVEEMKRDARFGRAFDSEAPVGSGMDPRGGSGKPQKSEAGPRSATQRIADGLKKGRLHGARTPEGLR